MHDFTYGQAYADWQAELRASAAQPSYACRDGRDRPRGTGRLARLRAAVHFWPCPQLDV